MTEQEAERIRKAAREAANVSARAQGLPTRIEDASVLERVATVLRDPQNAAQAA